MPLHQLPPEVLLHVLRLLGSVFFRQDTRRLLVSKWWYQLAWPVLLHDLAFSAASLRRFILTFEREDVMSSMQNHPITTSLCLDGFQGWDALWSDNSKPARTNFEAVDAWTSELNGHLTSLVVILQRCAKLRSLTLKARPEHHDPRMDLQRRDYLMALPLAGLASISHLTCLEVDTAGTGLVNQSNAPGIHICREIRSMLPTLRRLRCRMTSICPDVLDAPEKRPLLDLEDVVVNLSLSEMSDSDTSYRYPSRCGHTYGGGFPQLKADMEAKAKDLAGRMRNPRIIRVVSHTLPGLKMHSFDALTGRRMLLPSATPWDADGEELEETVVGEEDFDSDSSSEEGLP
ncbi:hypothetical protein GGS23DRAFT_265006 [Durotheca rogersii]|uniref:uncharacterized protein n=1 Tax=Durotheca rogersii TaxID=419775 RepID=UPI00221FB3ED|nr:uncharacterized protein GGS23DRAFT_265006 [Durotheca rogersii]KAI5859872.1 hypothetical protein GGS23DRAFT_265006 [Durotheca rogersii]